MDEETFDDLTARLAGGTSDRRTGMKAALGALIGAAAMGGAASAERKKADGANRPPKPDEDARTEAASGNGTSAQGPCGDGSARSNTCRKDSECCTFVCDAGSGRCRCRVAGSACQRNENCCNTLTCSGGLCQKGGGGGGNQSGPTGPRGRTGATGPTGPVGGATPDGPTGAVQYNRDDTALGGNVGLFYDYADTLRVGIGTTQPAAGLDIVNPSPSVPALRVEGAVGQTGPMIQLFGPGPTSLMWITADVASNVWIGGNQPGAANTVGVDNIGIGSFALTANTTGDYNTAVGALALVSNTTGSGNSAFGLNAGYANTTGDHNTALGTDALYSNGTASRNVAVGWKALERASSAECTAVGTAALRYQTTGDFNTGVGFSALLNNESGDSNTAVGYNALKANTAGYNVAVGVSALAVNTTGADNTAIGTSALLVNTSGDSNTGVGAGALIALTTGNNNTALGARAANSVITFSNTTALGAYADVTGSDQVQLGDAATTTYVYNTVQTRSDVRDKTGVRDTVLGLDFITALRPVDYRWDMREDYRPAQPAAPAASASDAERAAYADAMAQWREASRMGTLSRDGSKARTRYHHGFIAQEVRDLIAATGIDFGGFQDHTVAGGEDVLSLGYDEFIAPLIRAVQELAGIVRRQDAELADLRAAIQPRA
ncbi:MAG: hypothetical protein ACKOWF_17550 [Chloroflexota bacterium]